VLALVLTGCAGPTVSESALESQATRSTQAAASELSTVELATGVALDGDAWWAYTDDVVTASEKTVGAVEATFTSRQPPDSAVDRLYDQTSAALADAADLVTHMRIAVRRHDQAEVSRLRQGIPDLVDRLIRAGQAES
jgi:hypothetical protein